MVSCHVDVATRTGERRTVAVAGGCPRNQHFDKKIACRRGVDKRGLEADLRPLAMDVRPDVVVCVQDRLRRRRVVVGEDTVDGVVHGVRHSHLQRRVGHEPVVGNREGEARDTNGCVLKTESRDYELGPSRW